YGSSGIYAIGLNNSENIIVTGSFTIGAQFGDITLISSDSGTPNAFIAHLDTRGNVNWAKKITSAPLSHSSGSHVRITKAGSHLIAGSFRGKASFDLDNIQTQGYHNIYVAQYSNDGTLEWVNTAGNSNGVGVVGMDLSPSGDIFINGF